jgi:voltage-gated potassium channel
MLVKELLLATAMVILVVFLHLMGLALLWRGLRSHSKVFRSLRILPLTLLLSATLGLIFLHTLDIWLYTALYLYLGAFPTLEQSLYFSTVTYSSLGYGDFLLPEKWRVLGAIECPAGIILLGISTAFMITVLTKFRLLLGHDWLSGADDGGDPQQMSD